MNTLKHFSLYSSAKIALIIFLALNPVATILATIQRSDIVIYRDTKYLLDSTPLEEYFTNNVGKRPEFKSKRTSLWRGYIAILEIKDGWLFVKEINQDMGRDASSGEDIWKDVTSDIFTDPDDRRFDWFSGLLVLPHGKIVKWVNFDTIPIFENYVILEISNGKSVKELRIPGQEYEAYQRKQFELFRQTDDYKKIREIRIKNGYKPENVDEYIERDVFYCSKKILIDSPPPKTETTATRQADKVKKRKP